MKLIGKDTIDGHVVEVSCGFVVVQFDTGDDVIYEFDQFQEVPKQGDYIRVVAEIFLMPPPEIERKDANPFYYDKIPKDGDDNHLDHRF